ncbi:MAG: polyprenyl synthetase family protein [Pseudomonadota bacterium]
MSFEQELRAASEQVDAHLDQAIGALPPLPLTAAMGYALAGGKGLRGYFVLEGAGLFGLPAKDALGAAAAVEALHAYSLVHDDLPAMDDDDLRRGHPTVHVKWDEATAVLVGDALQSLAFELIASSDTVSAETRLKLVHTLAQAAGAAGMVAGQAMDIAAETAPVPLSLNEIIDLQAKKTGALILWATEAGAHLAEEDPSPLSTYGRALGLAFQIADDLLDVTSDAETMGKATGKDAGAGKATFVSHLGVEGARARAEALVEEACDALAPFGLRASSLIAAARFVTARKN